MARGSYEVHADGQTVSTAITVLEVTAPATAILRILTAYCSVQGATTPISARFRLLRKSGTITGTASPPTANPTGADAASGVTVKWLASAEGTDGVVIFEDDVQYLQSPGWLYLPVERRRVIVPPSGIIALKFPAAPTSGVFSFGIAYEEEG